MKKVIFIEAAALPDITPIITLPCSENPKSGDVVLDRNNNVAYRINNVVYVSDEAQQTVEVYYAVTLI